MLSQTWCSDSQLGAQDWNPVLLQEAFLTLVSSSCIVLECVSLQVIENPKQCTHPEEYVLLARSLEIRDSRIYTVTLIGTCYIIYEIQCKMVMQDPFLKICPNFRTVTAECSTKCKVALSAEACVTGPVKLNLALMMSELRVCICNFLVLSHLDTRCQIEVNGQRRTQNAKSTCVLVGQN